MAGTAPNLKLQKGTYYVRVQIPADAQAAIGKREFWESLQTSNFHDAKKAAPPIIARFKRLIAAARGQGKRDLLDLMPARIALANWAAQETRSIASPAGDTTTPWFVVRDTDMLKRAWSDPEGWREIEGYDDFLCRVLTIHGYPTNAVDPASGVRGDEDANLGVRPE